MEWTVLLIIFPVLMIAGAALSWMVGPRPAKKDKEPNLTQGTDKSRIIILDEDEPQMHLHDAIRALRAEYLGLDADDTCSRDYVTQLDDILTDEALENGENQYLMWMSKNAEDANRRELLSSMCRKHQWDIVEAMLQEEMEDQIDVSQIIMYLKEITPASIGDGVIEVVQTISK